MINLRGKGVVVNLGHSILHPKETEIKTRAQNNTNQLQRSCRVEEIGLNYIV